MRRQRRKWAYKEEAEDVPYFKITKDKKYAAQRKYNNMVKHAVIKRYLTGIRWLLDIGTGMGQEIGKYLSAKIRNVILMDRDQRALEIARKRVKRPLDAHFVLADVTAYNPSVMFSICSIRPGQVDAVVSNLAIHYFIWDQHSLYRFIMLVKCTLKSGGLCMFTCMNGGKIHNLLRGINFGETLELRSHRSILTGDTMRYGIKRLYEECDESLLGCKIAVSLPFIESDEMYEENLINIDYLCDEFKRYGFALVGRNSFDSTRLMATPPVLSPVERQWVSMYEWVILRKKK